MWEEVLLCVMHRSERCCHVAYVDDMHLRGIFREVNDSGSEASPDSHLNSSPHEFNATFSAAQLNNYNAILQTMQTTNGRPHTVNWQNQYSSGARYRTVSVISDNIYRALAAAAAAVVVFFMAPEKAFLACTMLNNKKFLPISGHLLEWPI